jgi:riboflavin kinase/FMN adenylyltransferase
VTDIDLSAVSTTGDPEGELSPREPPSAAELERLLEALRGEVELPVPAFSAVKIEGRRAYRLARAGTAVEMPVRRSTVRSLSLLEYDGRVARLDLLVSSGTYVRSIAAALGGHCATLRRTEVGPFLGRGGGRGAHPAAGEGARPAVTVARASRELEPRPRAVALGTFDGVHRGHRRVLEAAVDAGAGLTPTMVTFDPHPRQVLGQEVELLATLERRLELVAEAGIEDVLVVEFTEGVSRWSRRTSSRACSSRSGRRSWWRAQGSASAGRVRATSTCCGSSASTCGRSRSWKACRPPHVRQLLRAGEVAVAARLLGRPAEVEGVVVSGDARGAGLGFPTANVEPPPGLLVPANGIYAGAGAGTRAAISIGTNPQYGGTERRVEAFLLDFEGDLYGQRLVVELWQRLRDEAVFETEQALVDQIARDVEATRRATRPA